MSKSSTHIHPGHSRYECWWGLRSLHWILLILLVAEHFLQWLTYSLVSMASFRKCWRVSLTFERLLYIYGFFRARLEVWNSSLGLAEGHGTLRWYLWTQSASYHSWYEELQLTTLLFSSTSILLPSTTCSRVLAPRSPKSNVSTYERKVVRISGRSLDQEFISPAIERIETLRVIDIVDKHAAVGASVERNT